MLALPLQLANQLVLGMLWQPAALLVLVVPSQSAGLAALVMLLQPTMRSLEIVVLVARLLLA